MGWNARHFCSHNKRQQEAASQIARSYSWVKSVLQGADLNEDRASFAEALTAAGYPAV